LDEALQEVESPIDSEFESPMDDAAMLPSHIGLEDAAKSPLWKGTPACPPNGHLGSSMAPRPSEEDFSFCERHLKDFSFACPPDGHLGSSMAPRPSEEDFFFPGDLRSVMEELVDGGPPRLEQIHHGFAGVSQSGMPLRELQVAATQTSRDSIKEKDSALTDPQVAASTLLALEELERLVEPWVERAFGRLEKEGRLPKPGKPEPLAPLPQAPPQAYGASQHTAEPPSIRRTTDDAVEGGVDRRLSEGEHWSPNGAYRVGPARNAIDAPIDEPTSQGEHWSPNGAFRVGPARNAMDAPIDELTSQLENWSPNVTYRLGPARHASDARCASSWGDGGQNSRFVLSDSIFNEEGVRARPSFPGLLA